MKKIQLSVIGFLLMTLISISAYSQVSDIVPVDEDTKLVTYKEVVAQEGEISTLYNRAIAWVNANYHNPTEVTRIRDAENGKLEIRHRIKLYNLGKDDVKTDAYTINYTMKLEFKFGRYRYTITDFNIQATSKQPIEQWLDKEKPTSGYDFYLRQLNDEVNKIIESLKKGMEPPVVKKDEW